MSPNTVARAFDRFFTTNYLGLGGVVLQMVERFLQEVGGHLIIECEYGVGTTSSRWNDSRAIDPREIITATTGGK